MSPGQRTLRRCSLRHANTTTPNHPMTSDERFSRIFYDFARKSHARREVAIFCGSLLIWLLAGFAMGLYFPSIHLIIPIVFLPWGVSILLSEWIRRPRPFSSEHYKQLIELAIATPSFPSQHSTIAFSLVVLFIDNPFVWPFMLVGAILVALGRLAVGVHYVSDVVVGALIGFGLAYAVRIATALFVFL